ncbi:Non-repetitive/WGA-negative nucleoporin C-terminal-domain-containing protein [Chytriomyces sp. MP71]|nr:Non-repetitive/WGA-negative nucleoporin C-terminal-domain-containing protein [Chytriomyces sp. MP71]
MTDILKSATKVLDAKLASDRRPDLIDLLRKNGAYQFSPEPLLESVMRERSIPLPDVLYEQYDFLQCRCFLGLFPQLHRAWISIDHQLFLWNYEAPDEFEVFDDQDQVIVSVGLVKPLPGVFLDEINYLLVVATPIEIILVAVAFSETKGLNLYRTDIAIASDNVSMTSITGSKDGRIFMCGSNGRLYELQYQAEDGWFTRKCKKVDLTTTSISMFIPTFINFAEEDPIRKIAVDDSRNLLYALTEKSNIELFYLGLEGKEFKRNNRALDIFSQAQKWLENCNIYPHPYLDPRNFQIIAIHVIPLSDSDYLNLMAVTSSGFRLYFSVHKNDIYSPTPDRRPNREPNTFQLTYVRPPPPNWERLRLHESCYANGTVVAANAVNDETDSVTCFAAERATSTELLGAERIEGKTWSICENMVRNKPPSTAEEYMVDAAFVRKNIVLTNAGITVFVTRRPIDILLTILENTSTSGNWPQGIATYQSWFSPEQICAMCLSIIASREYGITNLGSWAKRLYHEVGGKPSLRQDSGQMRLVDNGPLGRPLTMNEYVFSGRHEGLGLYMSRLLFPLWKVPIAKRDAKGELVWKQGNSILGSIADSLRAIDALLNENPVWTSAPNPNDIDYDNIGSSLVAGEKEAWQEEKQSMRNLHALIKKIIEGIAFLVLLMDYKFLSLSASLEPNLVQFLVDEPFENLVTLEKGREAGKAIFTKIVQVLIAKNEGVTEICDRAQAQCHTFCCVEDVVLYKGMELLSKAKSENGDLGRALLAESLSLFLNILPSLNFTKISELVMQYQSVQDHFGAINLALSFAQTEDPNAVAFSYYADGMPANDYREAFYTKRYACYELVKSMILNVEPPVQENATGSAQVVDEYRKELIHFALQFNDKLFHYFIFDWFLKAHLTSQMLETPSDYLEDYLGQDTSLERFDLLSRLYVRKGEFIKAAQVLRAMAASKHNIPFFKRLELLQMALANAKSATVTVLDHDFLRELEDKKDVALVQMEVLTAANKLNVLSPDDALYESLLGISELYTNYTRPLQLHEISLLILHVSEHKDAQLVQQIWSKLVREVTESTQIADGEKLLLLEEKVKALGERYLSNESVFPPAFLCAFLESVGYQNEALRGGHDDPWVIRVLHAIGVTYKRLFEIYYEMFEARSAPWNTPAGEQYITGRLVHLITKWCDTLDANPVERTSFPAKNVDDAIAKLLLVAGGGRALGGGASAGHQQLQVGLQKLQDRVRRSFL